MKYDIIIVGAGISGALLAAKLAQQYKVLILESGQIQSHQDSLKRYHLNDTLSADLFFPYHHSPLSQSPDFTNLEQYYDQPTDNRYKGIFLKSVAGSSLAWLGTSLRLHPEDFKLYSLYGVGCDWPISYKELEKWYLEAENELGVAGDNSYYDHYLEQMLTKFPMPAVKPGFIGATVQNLINNAMFDGHQCTVSVLPQARNTVDGYNNRPQCANSHSCVPFCPTRAKYDANVHIDRALQDGATLFHEAIATQLNLSQDGTHIDSVEYIDMTGKVQTACANIFILACNAIETPRLLLASRPGGIANSSQLVGKNLMEHPTLVSMAYSIKPMQHGGPLITHGINCFTFGGFRKNHAAFRVDIAEGGFNFLGFPESRAKLKPICEKFNLDIAHELSLYSILEQLPSMDCYVELSDQKDAAGIFKPKIHYKYDQYLYDGIEKAKKFHELVFNKVGVHYIQHQEEISSVGHIIGTTKMGHDPKHSVVDKNLQSHDYDNLYITGSSVFPTAGCNNPTLTIAALALRLGDYLCRMKAYKP